MHQTPDASAKIRGEKGQGLLSANNVRHRGLLRYSGPMISGDELIASADLALRTLNRGARAGRPMPRAGTAADEATLSADERRLSGALMRVNHVGEVCAQALYAAQALTARTPELRAQMVAAGREETDHLAWTERRIEDLGGSRSILNPAFYAGSFVLGALSGLAGDRWNLGFLAETERQVESHLRDHLSRLPPADLSSRRILEVMQEDEARHARTAMEHGGEEFPPPLKLAMKLASRLMTGATFRF